MFLCSKKARLRLLLKPLFFLGLLLKPLFFLGLLLKPLLFLELLTAKIIVITFFIQQFFMAPLFDDFSIAYNKNYIRVTDSGEPVGNNEGCTAAQQLFRSLLDELFGLGVNGRCGFVQNKDGRVCNNGPGKGNQLFFTGGQAAAALTYIGLIAVLKLFYNLVGPHGFRGGPDVLICGIQTSITDIFRDRTGKQMRALKNIADIAVKP